jgi:hypothetical protein
MAALSHWLVDDDGDFVNLANIAMAFAERVHVNDDEMGWRMRIDCINDNYTYLPGQWPTREKAQEAFGTILNSVAVTARGDLA